MWRLVFDWTVLAPGKLLASVVAPLLFLLPPLSAFGTFVGVVRLLEYPSRGGPERKATWILAALLAFYVFFVVGVAVSNLPAAISRFMKMAD
jgi:hypothetical protein